MDSATEGTGVSNGVQVPRGVELETAVELFLLRMYDADAETNSPGAKDEDGGDAEKTKIAAEDTQISQGGREATRMSSDSRRWEIWLLGTLEGASPNTKKADGENVGAVLLHRGVRASNLEFVEGEMRVLQDPPSAESGSCTREGWAIEVRRWRWARS
jgi:hypothetical protein